MEQGSGPLYIVFKLRPNGAIEMNEKLRKSRELFQNPYAYLDGDGKFSAAESSPQKKQGTRRRTNREIEGAARNLQIQLWKQRKLIWPDDNNLRPEHILDPVMALRWLGFDCDYDEALRQFNTRGSSTEVAGIMDNTAKRVRISREFPVNIRNFTGAHELGHAVLEHRGRGLHRDRPQDGSGKDTSRPGQEIEADKFATYFLMPGKLVRRAFKKNFGVEPFFLTEDTMFALLGNDSMDLQKRCKTRRDLSRIIAGTERYNGVRFTSLANKFRVSSEAMAIRLEELDLVDFPTANR